VDLKYVGRLFLDTETWEPPQYSLVDTGKPRKTCGNQDKPIETKKNLCQGRPVNQEKAVTKKTLYPKS
jgi:hypothetical protein